MEVGRPAGAGAVRSWLYVPGDRQRMLDGADQRGADALILDLEDAVAPDGKQRARELVARWLEDAPRADGTPQRWVRLNADGLDQDLAAVDCSQVDGVVLPGATVDGLAGLERALDRHQDGLRPPVVALVETAAGVQQLEALAGVPAVRRLALGEADLGGRLGLASDRPDLLEPIRLRVVVASAAAGLVAPYGPTSTTIDDPDGLRTSTEELLAQGFRGRTAIHPAQVPVINAVFTPDEHEVAAAREAVAAFEAAGGGAARGEDGRMVDVATVRSAKDVLARARSAAGHD